MGREKGEKSADAACLLYRRLLLQGQSLPAYMCHRPLAGGGFWPGGPGMRNHPNQHRANLCAQQALDHFARTHSARLWRKCMLSQCCNSSYYCERCMPLVSPVLFTPFAATLLLLSSAHHLMIPASSEVRQQMMKSGLLRMVVQ